MSYEAASDRYSAIPYVRVGRSGLKLPRISLGLWNNFGTDRPWDVQNAIVRRAFDRGVTHFDLANNYGPPGGAAEENFGRILDRGFRRYRDELVISTKAGYDMWDGPYGDWGSRKYMLSSLDASLSRMGLDYVDIFYSHRADPDTPIEETMGALVTAVRQGKALYAGISNYNVGETRAAQAALAAEGIPLLIHQVRYNVFDRTPEEGLFDTLDELGAGCIVYSPLAEGLATNRYFEGVPVDSRAAEGSSIRRENISETYLDRARALNEIAKNRGQTLAQLALTWVLRQPQVTSALVGASSVPQLNDNLAAADAPDLTQAEIAAIEPFAVHGTAE
ncbi:MAG: aldo/keto reductase [Cryobacterium sp.]|nr:aldo/keto reductase [Cryobacterium sp.]